MIPAHRYGTKTKSFFSLYLLQYFSLQNTERLSLRISYSSIYNDSLIGEF